MIAESFWRIFWRDNWLSIIVAVKNFWVKKLKFCEFVQFYNLSQWVSQFHRKIGPQIYVNIWAGNGTHFQTLSDPMMTQRMTL